MRSVQSLAEKFGWEILSLPRPETAVEGGYAGDLLSWVMVHARRGQLWVTIMTNVNVLAVAELTGVAGIVVAEGETPSQDVIERAKTLGINLLRSPKDTFETVSEIALALSRG